jgi:outer membrane lipoprotein-sorting protein
MRNCCGCSVRQIAVGVLLIVSGLAAAVEGQRPAATPTPSTEAAKPPAASVPQPGAETIERAVALYSDGSAHSSPFVQIYTPAGFATARREAGTVWIQAPQRVRFDYTAPEKKAFTYDAGEGRFFSPEDKQLTVRRLSEDEKARLPVVFLTQPTDLRRQYEISVDAGTDAPASRVLLTPRVPRPELAWLRLTVGKDGRVSELSYQDSAGNRTEFRFDAWQRGKARPAGDFRITGPPGTRIVEN